MMMAAQGEAGALAASLAELKAYLRIATSDEDAVLAGLLRSAAALCEGFVGQWLIVREARETVSGDGRWQRLSARPVAAILDVRAVDAAGVEEALPPERYAIDIDASGEGWVRLRGVGGGRRLCVRYRAGMAEDMNGLPEAIRQGIVRLAADHHAARSGEGAAPPAVVSALWRPWRRMRLA
ncbi:MULTISPECIES: phage head-tail connector protein [Sphingobium]|uniref:PhiE125 gp8 family phage protein n=1 Tax=Sphingobium baderi TaxID=1332080 RepID=A0A0S3F238_9SPHN|nr:MULTISPECIES: phage head-tail connector protein [Sphingobium]ALR21781.1 hypothetical protein ATN00_17225 [Sphingobium baderi]